jgi:hypothetical protein
MTAQNEEYEVVVTLRKSDQFHTSSDAHLAEIVRNTLRMAVQGNSAVREMVWSVDTRKLENETETRT